MRKLFILVTLISLFLLFGCGTGQEVLTDESEVVLEPIVSETEAGDYVIRLISEKSEYAADEPVKITAKLKYVGEKEEVKIYHAYSPFWFDIRETTRGIDIPYVMPLPLLETTLKRDEWFVQEYTKVGSYAEGDDSPEVEFMKRFLEGEAFPPGEYEIELRTDFYTGSIDEKEEEHNYTTSILIQVLD
ncbi:uncharacterized protein YcfL [Evansella vedderi]|uniref:Uncharacterized protein YcfL n=1 Tax=Evansella vedderi TaxID=38282 RepID=A0ABU0A2M0_9BACI|nr:hypothetical protein [Evansella vedderi]MDQ0257247.1 uncharacterized protein YcfL [Evansella vedderi]